LLDELSETAQETTEDEWLPEQTLAMQLLLWHVQARTKCFDAELLERFNRGYSAAAIGQLPPEPAPNDRGRDAVLARLSYQMDEFATRLEAIEEKQQPLWMGWDLARSKSGGAQ